ncbi:hypothetical protein N7532_011661 [Penicillium argentinense]|uniref:Auxiliary Activity family 9 catalytic domain-containing protein n=1 Tax=Penicillium argentinense TaxID=1131581 RepID=A0A9W9JV18_9EURO|nr:uncharacterized protein N7532_011661 [Penicillium argentinense]KAJ5082618.1 hypothetical protein N7532_011661 [Penicillium argentinense]
MSVSKIAGAILGSAALVAGHGYVSGAVVDGTYYGGFIVDTYNYETDFPDTIGWSEDATDLGFVDGSSYSSSDIICHKDASPGKISASVKAGGSVELQWTDWPESHHGPVITYLANCNGDCASVDKTSLKFFKIDEGGLIDDSNVPGTWASDNLISNNNSRTITIPSSIESGNYVLRHEIIALHSAGNANGAQNYPQCLNLKVTDGGSDSPEGTLGTALYKNTDPGIKVNIYQSMSSYTIPGPALYTGASSGSGSSGSTTTAATVAPVPTSSATPVSASPSRSPSSTPLRSTPLPPSYSATLVPTPSSQPQASQPAGEQNPPSGAPSDVPTATETAAAQVTDQSSFQTPSAQGADTVTVTASAGGQSQQSASPSSGSSSSGSSDPSDSSSSGSTGSSDSSSSSSYNSSDWTSYLNSLSAEQFVNLLRQTVKWLVTDKKHARDLSN